MSAFGENWLHLSSLLPPSTNTTTTTSGEKMTPHDLSAPTSPAPDPEEVRSRKMSRRAKVLQELMQTERDYLTDMELCVREVLKPLRELQVGVDVDRLFTNMEAAEIFIQAKGALEDVYKIYCYHHDEANLLLKTYEKEEDIKQQFNACILSLKGKPTLLNMGSLLIKPVQRIMKYPLLLGELWQATPGDHPDNQPLQEAYAAIKIINVNINEFKRRKDIVMKYKRSDDEGTLRGKLQKINIRSIRKKGDRFAGYLKILAGAESQVKDEVFDREEKLFRSLEKAVKQLLKDVHAYVQQAKEMVSVGVQNVHDLETIVKDPHKHITNGTCHESESTADPYKLFKEQLERLILAPLTCLQGMFSAPQKLIQKRYDKLLDYCSRLERSSSFNSSSSTSASFSTSSSSSTTNNPSSASSSSSPSPSSSTPSPVSDAQLPARRDYVALNAQLVEELQRFNVAAHTILVNCVVFLVALLRGLMDTTLHNVPAIHQLPAPLSNINEVQNSIMDELNNLTFVKDNAQKLMERKVSFERQREKKPAVLEVEHQSEEDRVWLLSEYPAGQLYQLKRKCNGCQEEDLSLLEGELVALLEDRDPHGSSTRWLARCEQELSLQEAQHVRILQFSDLGGNKDWWLAEANGQKGYVPANYLGKMSYA
ncbi:hypothetical protein CRUP_033428 [Coryphaenoides rupestris]|nr:hypothetical protein CRUP_033428 [Coryphaenoides rupestris]